MKRVVKWLLWIIGIVLVLALALLLSIDWIAAKVFVAQLQAQTGMEVGVQKVEVGIISPTLRIKGLQMNYPANLGGGILLKSPEMFVEYDRDARSRHELHFRQVRLDLDEVGVVNNGKPGANIIEKANQLLQSATNSPNPGPAMQGSGYSFTGIDKLSVSLGELHYAELSNPKAARDISVDIRNHEFTNVINYGDLLPLLAEILVKMAVGGVPLPPAK
jgi:hypothetical protein